MFLLADRLLLPLLFIVAHQPVHVGLDGQQLLHLVSRLAVVGICRLFLDEDQIPSIGHTI